MAEEITAPETPAVVEKQGFGGAQWQTMSGQTIEELLQDIGVTLGGISIQKALEQAAFLICCDVLAQDIAKAPIYLREELPNGTTQRILPTKHPIAKLLKLRPNRRHTWTEFKQMLVYWLAMTSNGYILINRALNGTILDLIPLRSTAVRDARITATGEVFYEITASTEHERALIGGFSRTVPERDMIHIRSRLIDGFNGYATLIAGAQTLKLGQSIEEYRQNLFGQDGQTRGVFLKEGDTPLPELAFERLRRQMRELMSRFRENTEPIVLEGGLKFQPISVDPTEADLTNQLQAQILNIAKLFRMPPHKIFHLDSSKYTNIETMEKSYVGDTLDPIFKSIEERFEIQLMSEEDQLRYIIQFDRDAVTVKDTKTLTEMVKAGMMTGLMEVNEGRAKFGWNPIPGGDTRLIPTNMTLVDRDNNVIIGGTNTGAKPGDNQAAEDEPPADSSKEVQLRLVSSQ